MLKQLLLGFSDQKCKSRWSSCRLSAAGVFQSQSIIRVFGLHQTDVIPTPGLNGYWN